MLLLVGLGNPNPNNSANRHNIGFAIIDAINQKFKLSKQKPKFKGLLTTGNIEEQKVFAIKPLTSMNSSGICIKELIEYYKIDVKDVFVFHDDMDIDLGKIKVKFGGSSAGHNGIESIDKNIGKSYARVRIGIGRPKNNDAGVDHVLDNFSIDETQSIQEVTNNITKSLSILIKKDLDLFSSKVNQKT
jgi:PTH1 family peptidyl-tRNA hydrolase